MAIGAGVLPPSAHMPVKGTIVVPSPDTQTPDVPLGAGVLLTPRDFGIPHDREPMAPKELAGYLKVSSDEIIGLIEEGQLRALPVRIGERNTYRIPYIEVVHFFLRQQGALN